MIFWGKFLIKKTRTLGVQKLWGTPIHTCHRMGTTEQQQTHFAPNHVEGKSNTWFAYSKSFLSSPFHWLLENCKKTNFKKSTHSNKSVIHHILKPAWKNSNKSVCVYV
jgi:hypothetical protein